MPQILGPKYHPLKPGAWRHASPVGDWVSPSPDADVPSAEDSAASHHLKRHYFRRTGTKRSGANIALFMMMGASLQPVSRVPAGNVLAVAGLEGRVNKCATLSDTPACPAMRAVTLQV